jgi:hypothetical protein
MSTYRDLIYFCIDKLKLVSDDSIFNEEHILFLLTKYRGFLLKQRYSDLRKPVSESNYQTVCLNLIEVPAMSGEPCECEYYLRSKEKVPFIIKVGSPRVYTIDYFNGEFSLISRDRMRYVGYNKYLKNIVYCTIGPDNYLYLKSANPQFLYLKKLRLTAIFQDVEEASNLECEGVSACDLFDKDFPMETALITPLLELVIKDLGQTIYNPEDKINNASDDLSGVNISNSNK